MNVKEYIIISNIQVYGDRLVSPADLKKFRDELGGDITKTAFGGKYNLGKYLSDKGIGTNKHYPIPMHLQECYKNLGYKEGDFPISEEISDTELSIPMYYGMTDEEVSYIIETINKFQLYWNSISQYVIE